MKNMSIATTTSFLVIIGMERDGTSGVVSSDLSIDQASPQVAPPPSSAAHSSHSDMPLQGPKKAGIKCFNCSKDGHYQSGCHFLAHCGVCDVDGHTTGMCPRAVKKPSLQWYGYAVDGIGFHCLEVEDAMLVAEAAEAENEAIVLRRKIVSPVNFCCKI
jgi:hypothetical protein